jgi:hypothetical protein
MTIANPLVVTVNSVAKSLPKINQDAYGSEYYKRETTQDFRVKIRHVREKADRNGIVMERHNVELTQTIFSTTPGIPDAVLQTYSVIRNANDADITKLGYLQVALGALLDATMVTDLAGWQN